MMMRHPVPRIMMVRVMIVVVLRIVARVRQAVAVLARHVAMVMHRLVLRAKAALVMKGVVFRIADQDRQVIEVVARHAGMMAPLRVLHAPVAQEMIVAVLRIVGRVQQVIEVIDHRVLLSVIVMTGAAVPPKQDRVRLAALVHHVRMRKAVSRIATPALKNLGNAKAAMSARSAKATHSHVGHFAKANEAIASAFRTRTTMA